MLADKFTKPSTAIVTGGIHRSGTTWLYNTVCNMFPIYKRSFFENRELMDNYVYKSHAWHKEFLNCHSVLIVRDLRSVAASLFAFDPLLNFYKLSYQNIIPILKELVEKECEDWKPTLTLKYENGKEVNTRLLINYFNLDIDCKQHVELINQIPLPTCTRDKKTELWPGHITNSNINNLPTSVYNEITEEFEWWFKKYGYRI